MAQVTVRPSLSVTLMYLLMSARPHRKSSIAWNAGPGRERRPPDNKVIVVKRNLKVFVAVIGVGFCEIRPYVQNSQTL
jgi:hypothetical protein